jgi:hypothetical protein
VNRVKAFGAFCYDFVVGDDWRLAVAVVLGLAGTALFVHRGLNPWWLVPAVTALGLGWSLRHARRAAATREPPGR